MNKGNSTMQTHRSGAFGAPFGTPKPAARSKVARVAYALFIALLWLCVPTAKAECWRVSVEFIQNLDMGSVLIDPKLPVGAVIATKKFPQTPSTRNVLDCRFNVGGGNAYGVVAQGAPVPGFSNVFTTGIAGVGIRVGVYEANGKLDNYFPFHFVLANNIIVTQFAGSYFQVDLIKTDAITGSGTAASGTFARTFGDDKLPYTTINIQANGLTIVTPTCAVDAGSQNILVQLGKVPRKNFTGVGSTAGTKPFNIQLNCAAGVGVNNAVHLRMDATADPYGQPGTLQVNQSADHAKGVGIQVLDKAGTPVKFGEDALVGPSKDGSYVLPFTARYIQAASDVTVGPANGVATFTIKYK